MVVVAALVAKSSTASAEGMFVKVGFNKWNDLIYG
jgi:hypothetical protein